MTRSIQTLGWIAVTLALTFAFGWIALNRGETINALWIVVAAVCVALLAYRFYSLFIARTVLETRPWRATPAVRYNDGLDYVPTNKYVLFGHHFAAIAGAGPLVGPVLAAQLGYLPGTLWILVGVVFAGAVQDFIVLFISMRRDGRSLGDMIRSEMGQVAGVIAMFGVLLIMIILLAVLALVVVKALAHSPWGSFTVFATIPIAMLMGVYTRYLRPGRIGEMSVIGFAALMAAIYFGQIVSENPTTGVDVHLQRRDAGADHHRLWLRRIRAAGLAAAGAARLPVHIPQDRHDPRSGARHPRRDARPSDAGGQPLRRRHRAGVLRSAVPLPVHHHRLRRCLRLPLADRIGHHAQDGREREPGPADRLRRDADGKLRRHHGADRRLRAGAGALLRDEQPGRPDRHDAGTGGAGDQFLGLRDHARDADPDGGGCRRGHDPVAGRRRSDAGGRHGAYPVVAPSAARR